MKMNYVTPQVEEMRYLANGDVMEDLLDMPLGASAAHDGEDL